MTKSLFQKNEETFDGIVFTADRIHCTTVFFFRIRVTNIFSYCIQNYEKKDYRT